MLWLNGKLQTAEEAGIDSADRGFLLGDGLFETICVRQGKFLRLPLHLARLENGCRVLRMTYPLVDIEAALQSVLDANQLKDGALRLTFTRGKGPRGVLPPKHAAPMLLITANPLPVMKPLACIMATVTRRNEYSPLSRIKSLNYLDSILARQEAADKDAQDAILLNTSGFVAEATSSNIFVVRDGRLYTPPVSAGALPGIMRAALLSEAIEQSLEPQDLESAEEIFLTSSLGVWPVSSLDGVPVGKSSDYPVTMLWKKRLAI